VYCYDVSVRPCDEELVTYHANNRRMDAMNMPVYIRLPNDHQTFHQGFEPASDSLNFAYVPSNS
jgi:hypothetical protein